jgi:flagellar biosynthesis protein FliP
MPKGLVMRMDSLLRTLLLIGILAIAAPAMGQTVMPDTAPPEAPTSEVQSDSPPSGTFQIPELTKRENFSGAMQIIILLTVLSLAPAILLMMTSFTRLIIVLSLLRQALGTQSLPPNQVMVGLAMFMTFLVMGPTFSRVNSASAVHERRDHPAGRSGPRAGAAARLHDRPDQGRPE